MNDGWLFKLRSNLGSRYVAPSWPSGDQREAAPDPAIAPEPSLTPGPKLASRAEDDDTAS